MRFTTFLVPTVAITVISMATGAAQQSLPRDPGDRQPGRKWTEEQLKQFTGAVRAGRKLTPRSWPNGARVAVVLTFSVTNTSNNFARGDSAVVQLTGGEFGALVGLPRVLDVLDRQNVPATFFIPATAAIVDPQMIPEIARRKPDASAQGRRHEIGVMGWSDENPLAIDNAGEEGRLLTRATGARILIDGDRFRSEMTGQTYDGVFNIDVEADPHAIDIEFVEGPEAGNRCYGLYELNGDQLTLCLGVAGATRPVAFATRSGSGHALERLRRASAERPVNVTGKTNVKLTVALAAAQIDFENDNNDYLDIIIFPNGADSVPITLASFHGVETGNQPWLADRLHGNQRRLTREFADFTYNIPADATDLIVQFEAGSTWWNEILAFDNVRITEGP